MFQAFKMHRPYDTNAVARTLPTPAVTVHQDGCGPVCPTSQQKKSLTIPFDSKEDMSNTTDILPQDYPFQNIPVILFAAFKYLETFFNCFNAVWN